MIDYEAIQKAIEQKNKHITRAEQLAGNNAGIFADFYDQHAQKLKDLSESVLLDMRYRLKFPYEKEVLVRLGMEALIGAMIACSNEKNKRLEPPKKERVKLKI